jgi:hypothetical protein
MTDPSMQSDGTIPFRTDNKHPRWRRRRQRRWWLAFDVTGSAASKSTKL